VRWQPATLRPGDVGLIVVRGAAGSASVAGSVAGRQLQFFPYPGGRAALAGLDLETKPGRLEWRIAVADGTRGPRALRGWVVVKPRRFPVERLTLPPAMVELDEETTRRAEAETAQLRSLFAGVTGERLWRGPFIAPVPSAGAGTGFGARRIINGHPRSPHTGLDYAADRGTPVIAANAGRVVLVADHFFPGRLAVVDHGLGLYTAYFHLDQVLVPEGAMVDRGQPIGVVGATGRATGPHLHFTAVLGSARIDPATLLALPVRH
jgi:murein DD-endopeptidase MepM/ murein hydrolase activator NlpD